MDSGSRDPNGLRIPVAPRVIGDSRIIERPWRPPAVVAISIDWVKIYAGRHPILVHSAQTLECRPLLRSASCQKRVPRAGCRRSPAEAFWPSWDWGPRQWPWFPHLFSLGPGQSGPYPTGQPGPSGRRLHFPPPLRLALTPNQLLNHGRPQGRLSGETLGSHVTAGGLSGSDSARGLRGRCPVQESG